MFVPSLPDREDLLAVAQEAWRQTWVAHATPEFPARVRELLGSVIVLHRDMTAEEPLPERRTPALQQRSLELQTAIFSLRDISPPRQVHPTMRMAYLLLAKHILRVEDATWD